MKNLTLLFCFFVLSFVGYGQTELTANQAPLYWNTSQSGAGYGHKLYSIDPGFHTDLRFAVRNNSTTWKDLMTLTTEGKVGINTTSPTSTLHITSNFVADYSANFSYRSIIYGENTRPMVGNYSPNLFLLNTNLKGVNFGLHSFVYTKTTPNGWADGVVRLSSSADANAYGPEHHYNNLNYIDFIGDGGGIDLGCNPNGASVSAPTVSLRGGNVGIGISNSLTAKLHVSANNDKDNALRLELGAFSMGGAAKFSIDAPYKPDGRFVVTEGGNVGINTTAPQGALHITSNFIDESNINQYGANAIIEAKSTTRTIGQGACLGFVVPVNTDGTNPWQQGRILVTPDDVTGTANGRMYLQTRGWSTKTSSWDWQNNLVLLSNGNVGIGTTTPDTELTVNGTIHAKSVVVDLKYPLADYVFDPTYDLKPLAEVEAFINANKHLPEVPSAAEVKEQGVNLGDMQNKLLQKIEELTLYSIAQNKKIEALEKEMIEMRKKSL